MSLSATITWATVLDQMAFPKYHVGNSIAQHLNKLNHDDQYDDRRKKQIVIVTCIAIGYCDVSDTACTKAVGGFTTLQQSSVSPILLPVLVKVLELVSLPNKMQFLLTEAVPLTGIGIPQAVS